MIEESKPEMSKTQRKLADKFIKRLQQHGTVNVTFTKKNGDKRLMICTKDMNLIPAANIPVLQENATAKPLNPDVIKVFDVEAKGWRTVLAESILEVE